MKTAKKALLLTVCALVLVAATVMGTMAYLTSQQSVTNVFTYGELAIKLDEAPTDEYGNITSTEREDRRESNSYKLVPAAVYAKDPAVWMQPNSEAAYLFVRYDFKNNGVLAGSVTLPGENGYGDRVETNIRTQITMENGWTELFIGGESAGVFYKAVPATGAEEEVMYPVFSRFGTSKTATTKELTEFAAQPLTVTAWAVQQDGFADAAEAWTATYGAKA